MSQISQPSPSNKLATAESLSLEWVRPTPVNSALLSRLRLICPHQNTEKLRIIRSAELTVVFNVGSQWDVSNSS